MSNVLVLGRGWVGTAVDAVAHRRPDVASVRVIDPPFEPALAGGDAAAVAHLREVLADGAVTAVINACGRVQGSAEELEDANLRFVVWLCDALTGTGVRLIHVGSASEYGDPGSADPVAEDAPLRPAGPYASTKAAGSEVVLTAAAAGMPATVARVFNIVGHPVPTASPIHQWLTDLRALGAEGGDIEVWWPPTTRDFVMLEDAARALVDLAVLDTAPPPLVNVCSGVGLQFGQIVEALAAALGVPAAVHSLDRPGIPAVVGDPSLLRTTIGWVPSMSVHALAERATGGAGSGGTTTASR